MAQIGGWNVNKISGVNLPATAEKVAPAGPLGVTKQHIIYGFDLTFNGTPGTPVLAQLYLPDASPNTLLWEGYVGQSLVKTFPEGLPCPIGQSVALTLSAGGGSLIGNVNLYGTTR